MPRSGNWAIIIGAEPHDEADPPLTRRTGKQWRHEDRELTSTHVLWNAAITAHTVIVAASGIFVGNDKFPLAPYLFPCGSLSFRLLPFSALLGLWSFSDNTTASVRRNFPQTYSNIAIARYSTNTANPNMNAAKQADDTATNADSSSHLSFGFFLPIWPCSVHYRHVA